MAPTVMSVIAVFYFVLGRQRKYFQFVDGVWIIESLYFEVRTVWAITELYFYPISCLRFPSLSGVGSL